MQPFSPRDNSESNSYTPHAPQASDSTDVVRCRRQLKVLAHFATIPSRRSEHNQRDTVVAIVSTLVEDDMAREIVIVTGRCVVNSVSDHLSTDMIAAHSPPLTWPELLHSIEVTQGYFTSERLHSTMHGNDSVYYFRRQRSAHLNPLPKRRRQPLESQAIRSNYHILQQRRDRIHFIQVCKESAGGIIRLGRNTSPVCIIAEIWDCVLANFWV